MSNTLLNQGLLDSIKRLAKQKKRDDPSRSYNQWLNALSAEYGYTFSSLTERVAELELEAANAADDLVWQQRFSTMVWGTIREDVTGLGYTLPLPIRQEGIPWPNCFAQSSLFSCAEGPRKQKDGPLFSEACEMLYAGEELRVEDDQSVLMVLMLTIGRAPCGTVVEFTTDDMDAATGPLPEFGMPVAYSDIAKSLWRLAHCKLVVHDFKFEGPILSYVDASKSPHRFVIRFNPDFARFFHPILKLLG